MDEVLLKDFAVMLGFDGPVENAIVSEKSSFRGDALRKVVNEKKKEQWTKDRPLGHTADDRGVI